MNYSAELKNLIHMGFFFTDLILNDLHWNAL